MHILGKKNYFLYIFAYFRQEKLIFCVFLHIAGKKEAYVPPHLRGGNRVSSAPKYRETLGAEEKAGTPGSGGAANTAMSKNALKNKKKREAKKGAALTTSVGGFN